ETSRCFLERVTGAATTRFWVKTAEADAGTSLERMARSSAPVFLRPQAVAAKRKPLGRAASVGAWVTWWLQCRGFFSRGRRWRRERSPGMYHREPFSQLARRRRTSFLRSRLQIPGRPFAILRVEVRSSSCPVFPLREEVCRRGRGLGGMERLCGRDNRQLQWQEARDSK